MSLNEDRGTDADVNPANLKDKDDVGEFASSDVAAVTIDAPREALYAFWRDLSNLPRVMTNVLRIDIIDARRSRWVVRGAGDGEVEWVSEIIEDEPDERIAWRATEDSEIKNSGWIEFRDGPLERGTEVRAFISYDPPLGSLGDIAAKALMRDPGVQARVELRRFKQLMETGEISTAEPPHAAPRGGKSE